MYETLAELSFVRHAQRIFLEAKREPTLSNEAISAARFLHEVRKFLEACDPHTEVIAFDEATAELMAVARSEP
jgi:hypothetical protein